MAKEARNARGLREKCEECEGPVQEDGEDDHGGRRLVVVVGVSKVGDCRSEEGRDAGPYVQNIWAARRERLTADKLLCPNPRVRVIVTSNAVAPVMEPMLMTVAPSAASVTASMMREPNLSTNGPHASPKSAPISVAHRFCVANCLWVR